MHVFRVEVSGPDGVKPHYKTQITAPAEAGEAAFALALNDQPGVWRIQATDVAIGGSGSGEFTVANARSGDRDLGRLGGAPPHIPQ